MLVGVALRKHRTSFIGATFNASDKHADITLSNGNKTAFFDGVTEGAWRSIRGTPSKTTGKLYYEFRMTGGINACGAGLARANDGSVLATWCGNTVNSIAVFQNSGGFWRSSADSNDIADGTVTRNTWYSLGIDLDGSDIRLFNASGVQIGTAEALPGGTGAFCLCCSVINPAGAEDDGIIEINADAPLNCVAPSGYSPWGS